MHPVQSALLIYIYIKWIKNKQKNPPKQVDTSLKLSKTSKCIFVSFKEITKASNMLSAVVEKKKEMKIKTMQSNKSQQGN